MIHIIILIFAPNNNKKERLKGEKITPVEIINNESLSSSKGNTNKNVVKKVTKKIQDTKDEKNKKEKKIQETKDIKLRQKNTQKRRIEIW